MLKLPTAQKALLDALTIKGCSDSDLDDLATAFAEADFGDDVFRSVSALVFSMTRLHGMAIMRMEMDSFWVDHKRQRGAEDAYDEKLAAIHAIEAT